MSCARRPDVFGRMYQQKFVSAGIIGVLVILIIIVIWSKLRG